MIESLLRLLEEAKRPSRELDCMIHECLAGHINECADPCLRAAEMCHGRVLVEKGGERLWTVVPHYTAEVDACWRLIPNTMAVSRMDGDPAFCAMIAALPEPSITYGNASAALTVLLAIARFRCSR